MIRGRISINRTPAARDPNGWVAIVYETTTGETLFRKAYPTRNEALEAITRYMDKRRFNR